MSPKIEHIDIDGRAMHEILVLAKSGGIRVSSALLGRTVAEGEAFENACRLGMVNVKGDRWWITEVGVQVLGALEKELGS